MQAAATPAWQGPPGVPGLWLSLATRSAAKRQPQATASSWMRIFTRSPLLWAMAGAKLLLLHRALLPSHSPSWVQQNL